MNKQFECARIWPIPDKDKMPRIISDLEVDDKKRFNTCPWTGGLHDWIYSSRKCAVVYHQDNINSTLERRNQQNYNNNEDTSEYSLNNLDAWILIKKAGKY